MTTTKLSLKGRALRYLSVREYSCVELAKKLQPFIEPPEQLETLLIWLQQQGFLSDERAATSIVNQKSSRFGMRRLRQQLHDKGVEQHIIEQNLDLLAETEFERALAVWQKKFNSPATTPEQRLKQMRFLAYRGFGQDIIHKVLKHMPDEQ